MPAPDVIQSRGDIGDGGLPVDLLEGAVGMAAERVAHAIAVLHVVGDREGLVADVALADRIGLIAAHRDDAPVVHVDAGAAIVAAEHAHRRQIGCGLHHDVASFRTGAGRACMSRAVTGAPQWSQVKRRLVTWPQARWMRSTGGPCLPAMCLSPQPAIMTTTPYRSWPFSVS